jgi:hypothetical protein
VSTRRVLREGGSMTQHTRAKHCITQHQSIAQRLLDFRFGVRQEGDERRGELLLDQLLLQYLQKKKTLYKKQSAYYIL